MASMSAGNLAIAQAALARLLELARRNSYQLSPDQYEALRQMSVATAVTY